MSQHEFDIVQFVEEHRPHFGHPAHAASQSPQEEAVAMNLLQKHGVGLKRMVRDLELVEDDVSEFQDGHDSV